MQAGRLLSGARLALLAVRADALRRRGFE